MRNMFYWILCENSAVARWLRTVLHCFAGVLVVALPEVRYALGDVLVALNMPEWAIVAIVPVVMLLLSPLMTKLGEWSVKSSPDQCIVCDAQGNEYFIDEVLQGCPEGAYSEAKLEMTLSVGDGHG